MTFAKKAVEKGADGVVLVAAGAGGHGGTYNPIPFVHEVRQFFDGPLILSGGLNHGVDVLVTECWELILLTWELGLFQPLKVLLKKNTKIWSLILRLKMFCILTPSVASMQII